MKIRRGDTVIVITGKNRGTVGEVLQTIPDNERVIVREVNIRTRHIKPRNRSEKGSIVKQEMPIAISNVALYDPKVKKPTRVYYAVEETKNGRKKTRMTRKSNTVLPAPSAQKKTKKVIKKDDK